MTTEDQKRYSFAQNRANGKEGKHAEETSHEYRATSRIEQISGRRAYVCGGGRRGRGVVLDREKMGAAGKKRWGRKSRELLWAAKERENGGVWSSGEICGHPVEEGAPEVGA